MQSRNSSNRYNMLEFLRLSPNAILPTRGSAASAGLDIYSSQHLVLKAGERFGVSTGIAVEIPPEHYGRVAPRSGIALNRGIDVMAGVIDSDYRGEVKCLLVNLGTEPFEINPGDRIAQLIIERIAILEPVWGEDLTDTVRSAGGFGSTGA